MNKKLYKSCNNQVICGVCGGFAEFFNIDPTIIRIIWAILICCFGAGLLAYIVCAIIMPQSPLEF